jgi:hypothetical protein
VSGSATADSDGSLRALQAASIIMGLPYTFVLFWNCQALLQVCAEEAGEVPVNGPKFSSRLFVQEPMMLLKNTFAPFLDMGYLVQLNGKWPLQITKNMWTGLFGLQWMMTILALILAAVDYQFIGVGFALYTLFAVFVAILRRDMRAAYDIRSGGMWSDFMCGFCMPMFAISQLIRHANAVQVPGKPSNGEASPSLLYKAQDEEKPPANTGGPVQEKEA